MRLLLLACLSLIFCACARTQINYTRYVGRQQEWAFAAGATVHRQFELPVYQGPPDRPYQVLGWVRVENARNNVRGLRVAVEEAARHGADAVVLLNNGVTAPSQSGQNRRPNARVMAIKFLPPAPAPAPAEIRPRLR